MRLARRRADSYKKDPTSSQTRRLHRDFNRRRRVRTILSSRLQNPDGRTHPMNHIPITSHNPFAPNILCTLQCYVVRRCQLLLPLVLPTLLLTCLLPASNIVVKTDDGFPCCCAHFFRRREQKFSIDDRP